MTRSSPGRLAPGPGGIVIVDKPAGMTSHDVVGRVRRLAGTRKVGHAGTLDPMATGVLVVGVEKATRLLGHLTLADKQYQATIRLGQATDTDDAEGAVIATTGADHVTEDAVRAAVAALTGLIEQVPPGVSAIKVGGQRAYKLTRDGQPPDLVARPVTVHAFTVTGLRRDGDFLDLDATVTCSSGTYIRALARDLGQALGTGGHLTALRRTRSGSYRIENARTLDELGQEFTVTSLAEAAAAAFPRLDLTEQDAVRVAHGARLPASVFPAADGPAAVFGPDGSLIALMRSEGGQTRPLAVFVP
jgi:tRNA pseudouridine55 synthase